MDDTYFKFKTKYFHAIRKINSIELRYKLIEDLFLLATENKELIPLVEMDIDTMELTRENVKNSQDIKAYNIIIIDLKNEVINSSEFTNKVLDNIELSKKAPANGKHKEKFKINKKEKIKDHPLKLLEDLKRTINSDFEKGISKINYDEFINSFGDEETNNALNKYVYIVNNALYGLQEPKTQQTPTHNLPKQKKEPEAKIYTTKEMLEIILKRDGEIMNIEKDTYRIKNNRIFKHTPDGYRDFDFNKDIIKMVFDKLS